MVVLKFIVECDRIKLLLWRASKIFRSIKAPDPAWKLYLSRGKERLTPRRIPRESSISRNVPISMGYCPSSKPSRFSHRPSASVSHFKASGMERRNFRAELW